MLLDIARWTAYTDAIFVFPSMIIVCTDSTPYSFFYQFPLFQSSFYFWFWLYFDIVVLKHAICYGGTIENTTDHQYWLYCGTEILFFFFLPTNFLSSSSFLLLYSFSPQLDFPSLVLFFSSFSFLSSSSYIFEYYLFILLLCYFSFLVFSFLLPCCLFFDRSRPF